eukprot:12204511-Karenia_brevis.AAC.1
MDFTVSPQRRGHFRRPVPFFTITTIIIIKVNHSISSSRSSSSSSLSIINTRPKEIYIRHSA